MMYVRKKIIYMCAMAVIMLSSATFFTAGEDGKNKIEEVSAVHKKNIYEIYADGNGNIILSEKSGNEEMIIRRGKASPMRKSDTEALLRGITTYSLEEALMMFEDFIS